MRPFLLNNLKNCLIQEADKVLYLCSDVKKGKFICKIYIHRTSKVGTKKALKNGSLSTYKN